MMSKESKLRDVNKLLDKNFRDDGDYVAQVKVALGETDFGRVKAALEGPVLRAFLDADVPSTAYHGDATTGNFLVHDYSNDGFKDLSVVDVGAMKYSIDGKTGQAIKTGAVDVARFLGSLETLPSNLTSSELHQLRDNFTQAYFKSLRASSGHDVDRAKFKQAETWYRIEVEVMAIKSDSRGKRRLLQLLGLEASP
jgi:hypothetical protein